MFNVTDANGKSFQFTLEQIQDLNSSIFDYQPYNISSKVDLKDFVVPIVDEKGNEVGKVGDIAKITDSNNGEMPKAIMVGIESTHSGDNHNYAIYHSDSMEKDGVTMVAPFNKPLLKNHDRTSEPLGRIKDQLFKQSDICPERDTIFIDVKVTDKDAIEKFLDGRYKTVSIGGSVGHIKCNICGKDILKDKKFKFCGHFKGEKYGDNLSLWHLRDITYNECSVVNSPADDFAQVVKITVLNDDASDSNEKDPIADDIHDDNTNIADNNSDDDSCIIDDLLDDNDNNSSDEGNGEEPVIDDNVNEDDEGEVNDDENNDYQKIIDSLTEENNTLKDNIENKDSEISDLNSKVDKLNRQIASLDSNCNEYKNISVRLANQNKKLLIDKLVLLRGEKLEDSNEELQKLSAKEISNMISDFINNLEQPKPSIPKVKNPGLVNPKDNYSIKENDEEIEKSIDSSKSNNDILDSIINNMYK